MRELRAYREAVKAVGMRTFFEASKYLKTFTLYQRGIFIRLLLTHPSNTRRSRKMKAYARRNGIT